MLTSIVIRVILHTWPFFLYFKMKIPQTSEDNNKDLSYKLLLPPPSPTTFFSFSIHHDFLYEKKSWLEVSCLYLRNSVVHGGKNNKTFWDMVQVLSFFFNFLMALIQLTLYGWKGRNKNGGRKKVKENENREVTLHV